MASIWSSELGRVRHQVPAVGAHARRSHQPAPRHPRPTLPGTRDATRPPQQCTLPDGATGGAAPAQPLHRPRAAAPRRRGGQARRRRGTA
eukprot:9172446-Alexandrium_andersonii.AAC.1